MEVLTKREQEAIAAINAALSSDSDDMGSQWADCGEVDVPILLDAVRRLAALAATPAAPDAGLLGELARLDAAATAGPWRVPKGSGSVVAGGLLAQAIYIADFSDGVTEQVDADANLTVAMRNALPALLARHGAPAAAAVAGSWPAPLEYPANKPDEEGMQYYVLTAAGPKEVHLKLWLTDEDTNKRVWMDWDEGYLPTDNIVTHFWPLPTAP